MSNFGQTPITPSSENHQASLEAEGLNSPSWDQSAAVYLVLRRLNRLELLLDMNAPEIVLRNEWRLLCQASRAFFASREKRRRANADACLASASNSLLCSAPPATGEYCGESCQTPLRACANT